MPSRDLAGRSQAVASGLSVRASCACQLAATFDRLDALPGDALRPFGLRLEYVPAPWYSVPHRRHRHALHELPSAERPSELGALGHLPSPMLVCRLRWMC